RIVWTEVVPTHVSKLRDSADGVTTGAASVPLPTRLTVCGLSPASSAITTVALRGPRASGEKVTEKEAWAPGASTKGAGGGRRGNGLGVGPRQGNARDGEGRRAAVGDRDGLCRARAADRLNEEERGVRQADGGGRADRGAGQADRVRAAVGIVGDGDRRGAR